MKGVKNLILAGYSGRLLFTFIFSDMLLKINSLLVLFGDKLLSVWLLVPVQLGYLSLILFIAFRLGWLKSEMLYLPSLRDLFWIGVAILFMLSFVTLPSLFP